MSVASEEARTSSWPDAERDSPEPGPWSRQRWFLLAVIFSTAGIATVAVADILGRRGSEAANFVLWAGLVAIIAPLAIRLASRSPTRAERLALVSIASLAIYLVKVLYSPRMFLFSDEFVHLRNAQLAITNGHLFNSNALLPETTGYPGLAAATSAFTSITGLGTFSAGLLVIGTARLILALGLFLLIENLTSSSRVAGLGVLLYAGNGNFFFYSAAYSYEPLALPLFLTVLFLLSLRRRDRGLSVRALIAAGLLTGAIATTHHLTSYVVAVSALVLAALAVRRRAEASRPLWVFAFFAVILSVVWTFTVAKLTIPYLHYILGTAFSGFFDVVSTGTGGRGLFSSQGGYVTPLAIRGLSAASSGLLLVLLIVGLVSLWRHHRRDPLAVILGLGAIGYFGTLLLRFAPSAWETGNRASEFLFIGLGLTAALGADVLLKGRSRRALATIFVAVVSTVVVLGGIPAGWSPRLLLPRPFAISADGHTIEPAGVAIARWSSLQLPPGSRFFSDNSNARLLTALAHNVAGRRAGLQTWAVIGPSDLLVTPEFPAWQLREFRRTSTRYILVDRRSVSGDGLAGYYWSVLKGSGTQNAFIPNSVFHKYGRAGADLVLDGGFITMYDMARLTRRNHAAG
jgi:hypothetical protein